MSLGFLRHSFRPGALLLLAALFLPACKEDGPPILLSPAQEAAVKAKADEAIAEIVRRNPPGRFTAVVVFRSDVFLYQSAMLEGRNIPVLDGVDNAAVLLLAADDVPGLLAEKGVTKASYFSAPGRLSRLHPTFLMEILRRHGRGKEAGAIAFSARFRDRPKPEEIKAVEAAGFKILESAGPVLTLSGPLEALPRLLGPDLITFFEGPFPPGTGSDS